MKSRWLAVLAGFGVLAHGAAAGPRGPKANERGNGSDVRAIHAGSAWFLSPQGVRYCVEVAPDFGVGAGEVRAAVQAALDTWSAYESSRHGHAPDVMHNITNRYFYSPTCGDDVPLEFTVGTSSERVTVAQQALGLEHPIAFALRTHYDMDTGRGRGFVWVSPSSAVKAGFPDWTKPFTLRAILLHEVGHIFGVEHVTDTIMDEGFADTIERMPSLSTEVAEAYATRIDHRIALLCDDCDVQYDGTLRNEYEPESIARDSFRLLMARDAVGAIAARLSVSNRFSLHLDVRDAIGGRTFELRRSIPGRSYFNGTWSTFVRAFNDQHDDGSVGPRRYAAQTTAYAEPARVTSTDGRALDVLVTWNMDRYPVTVTTLNADGTRVSLFYPRLLVPGGN